MVYFKRIIAVTLILSMLTLMFVGCGDSKNTEENNTLTINMWASAVPNILKILKNKFPDINFVVNEYEGANSSLYHKKLLERGQSGDIFFYTTFYNDSDAHNYLVDLSGYPFLANYDRAILSTLDVNGAIYQIPGPISVRYLAVNKTLFEEKGWKIPKNFEEMVNVCKQIHNEEPDIVPLGLGMAVMGFAWSLVASYSQMGYLNTAEGQAAVQGYRNGTASFAYAFNEGLDMISQLIDAGAFAPEKFEKIWDVNPIHLGNREVAMGYIMSPNADMTKLISGQASDNPEFGEYRNDEFAVLPFFGKNEKNKGLILGTTNTWGINKRLEEKGNEKKLENALRVLEYISSEEGQLAIRTDTSTIPAIKNLSTDDIPDFIKNLWNDSTNSIKSFFLYTGYEHMMVETGIILAEAMKNCSSKGMKEKFIRVADQLNSSFLRHNSSIATFGYAPRDLSEKQTRKICCEAFRETAKTDIAFASESGLKNGAHNKNGLSGKLFKGDIVNESLTVIVASKIENVAFVDLKGKEIIDMIKNGKLIPNTYGKNESFDYWATGIDIIKDNGRLTQIYFKGKPIDENSTYKVAMLTNDYSEDFAKNHNITDTQVNIIDSLANYFKAHGTIQVEN